MFLQLPDKVLWPVSNSQCPAQIFSAGGLGVLLSYIVYILLKVTINKYSMRKTYIHPDTCELEAGYLLALAQSLTEGEGSLEGFDNDFTEIEW